MIVAIRKLKSIRDSSICCLEATPGVGIDPEDGCLRRISMGYMSVVYGDLRLACA
jgi:hypothetical protein